MKAIPGLVSAGSALWRNPLILAVMVPLALLYVFWPTTTFIPFVGDSSSSLFISLGVWTILFLVTVFFNGGIYGMAHQALDGRTDLGNFLQEARGNHVRLLLGTLLQGGISIVTTIVGVNLTMIVGGLIVVLTGPARGSTPLQVGVGGIALAFVLVWLLILLLGSLVITAPVFFFIQFFDAAIVVDNTPIFESFRRSAGLVRRNLLSTLGYSLFRGMIWILSLLVFLSVYIASPTQSGGTQPWLAGLVDNGMFYVLSSLQIGLLLVIGVFWRTYKISYYSEMIVVE